jgi:hypothetical protein
VADLLVTLLVGCVLGALGCVAFVLFTVVPFVVGVDMAERRGFSTDRWGAFCLLSVSLAAALAFLVHQRDLSSLLYLPAVALTWAVPGVLALLDASQRTLGGRAGAHER